MKIIQITTGIISGTYNDILNDVDHILYGLDENGEVYYFENGEWINIIKKPQA